MIPEIKTIYSSMLSRRNYNNLSVEKIPKYVIDIVLKYDDIINLDFGELENVKQILEIIKNEMDDIHT